MEWNCNQLGMKTFRRDTLYSNLSDYRNSGHQRDENFPKSLMLGEDKGHRWSFSPGKRFHTIVTTGLNA